MNIEGQIFILIFHESASFTGYRRSCIHSGTASDEVASLSVHPKHCHRMHHIVRVVFFYRCSPRDESSGTDKCSCGNSFVKFPPTPMKLRPYLNSASVVWTDEKTNFQTLSDHMSTSSCRNSKSGPFCVVHWGRGDNPRAEHACSERGLNGRPPGGDRQRVRAR